MSKAIEKDLDEIYNLCLVKSKHIFVAFQRLFIDLMYAYYSDKISEFYDNQKHVKEYEAITNMIAECVGDSNEIMSFSGLWGVANRVKHGDEEIPFRINYIYLCASTYNRIAKNVLIENSQLIELDRLKEKEETSISIALKKAIEKKETGGSLGNTQSDEVDNIISSIPINQAIQEIKNARLNIDKCPNCGGTLTVKTNSGDGSKFLGCSNYRSKECNYTENFTSISDKKSAKKRKQSLWYFARPKTENAKVKFIQSIGLPYDSFDCLQAKHQEIKKHGHFRVDFIPKENEDTTEKKLVLSLAYKILTRGRVTVLSPQVEEKILALLKLKGLEEITIDQFDFLSNYSSEIQPVNRWFDGVGYEEKFYNEYLPEIMGSNWYKLVSPQVSLQSLVNTNYNLGYQRVDFAINDCDTKLVIEIDDSSHLDHKEYDDARDNLLIESGYSVVRIPNQEIIGGNGPNLKLVSGLLSKYNSERNTINKQQLGLILCKIAHQIQIAIIVSMQYGCCSPNAKINIEEIGLPIEQKIFQEISDVVIEELNELLNNLTRLYELKEQDFRVQYEPSLENANFSISLNQEDVPTINCSVVADLIVEDDFLNHTPFFSPEKKSKAEESTLQYFLQFIFRKEHFRDGQLEVIRRILAREDSIVLLPTGAGKSICYQLSGLLMPGITMVVSPLISLMDDQVDNLYKYGIDRAVKISSSQDVEVKNEIVKTISSGDYHTVYLSPERLQLESFRKELQKTVRDIPIPLFAIDEAHCLSEWGHDFRTAYLNLGRIIREYCSHAGIPPTIVALTGTASDSVLKDIESQLSIGEESVITPKNFDRAELKYNILTCGDVDKFNQLTGLLDEIPRYFGTDETEFYQPNGKETYCGIIFCPHVDGDYGVSSIQNKLSGKYECVSYSGRYPEGFKGGKREWEKKKAENASNFKENQVSMIVATSAYGMGIDKQNVRYTIHYNMPKSVEAYYQETGRAGRDGKTSHCFMLATIEAGTGEKLSSSYVELKKQMNKKDKKKDDIDRMLFFHQKSFKGVDAELESVREVLEGLILPGPSEIVKTYSPNGDQIGTDSDGSIDVEKAIYRLLLIGVIKDYSKLKKDEYKIIVPYFSKEDVRDSYINFVEKYNPGRIEAERAKIQIYDSISDEREYILSIAKVLVEFIYEIIERGRANQISLMYEITKQSASYLDSFEQDEYIRKRVLKILSTTEHQAITNIISTESGGLVELGNIMISASKKRMHSLQAQASRALEATPDHPALLFLNVLDIIEQPIFSNDTIMSKLNQAIGFAKERYSVELEEIEHFIAQFLCQLFDVLSTNDKLDEFYSISNGLISGFDSSRLLEHMYATRKEDTEVARVVFQKYLSDYSDSILKILKVGKDVQKNGR